MEHWRPIYTLTTHATLTCRLTAAPCSTVLQGSKDFKLPPAGVRQYNKDAPAWQAGTRVDGVHKRGPGFASSVQRVLHTPKPSGTTASSLVRTYRKQQSCRTSSHLSKAYYYHQSGKLHGLEVCQSDLCRFHELLCFQHGWVAFPSKI